MHLCLACCIFWELLLGGTSSCCFCSCCSPVMMRLFGPLPLLPSNKQVEMPDGSRHTQPVYTQAYYLFGRWGRPAAPAGMIMTLSHKHLAVPTHLIASEWLVAVTAPDYAAAALQPRVIDRLCAG